MTEIVQPGGGGSGAALTVTDGSTTVNNVNDLIFSGATVTNAGGGGVIIAVTGTGGGTVTSVTSANGNATVANTTTTPIITIVSAPKLQTARTINGVSFDGTSNITIAANNYQQPTGTVNGTNNVFVFTTAPNVISVDGVTRQKVSSDGTVNWTGTTIVTLNQVPNNDVFGVA